MEVMAAEAGVVGGRAVWRRIMAVVARAREAWSRKMKSRRRRVVAAPVPPEASSRAYGMR